MHPGLLLFILVLAAANRIAFSAVLLLPDECNVVSWGVTGSMSFKLEKVFLIAEIRDWQVKIPIPPSCTSVTGMDSTVCDYDMLPNSSYINKFLLIVHRNGELQGGGSVQVTVHCD